MLGKYLKYLTPIKKGDDPRAVVNSQRMNAIQECIKGLARGDNIARGMHIRKRAGDGYVILNVDPRGSNRAGSDQLPFDVYESSDSSEPPYPILKVYPGTISNIMPTLKTGGGDGAGAPLDKPDEADGDHPWFYPPGTPFSFFLRCHVEGLDTGQNFRTGVTAVKVVSDDDPLAVPDIDPDTSEIAVLKMFWEGDTDEEKAQRLKGHFYLKVADVDMELDSEGNIVVKGIAQKLFQNYLSFAVAGDEVIVLI